MVWGPSLPLLLSLPPPLPVKGLLRVPGSGRAGAAARSSSTQHQQQQQQEQQEQRGSKGSRLRVHSGRDTVHTVRHTVARGKIGKGAAQQRHPQLNI